MKTSDAALQTGAVGHNGQIYVADRENSRVQIFAASGEYLRELSDLVRPTEVFVDREENIFVTEFGWRAGVFSWHVPPISPPLRAGEHL